MSEWLKKTDILVDTSLSEGFGLVPLEAMAAGAVPVVGNAFGNLTYCKNNVNSIVINEINNTECYIKAIDSLLSDDKKLQKYSKEAIKTACLFDFDNTVEKYYQTLTDITENKFTKIDQKITLQEMDKLSDYTYTNQEFQNQIKFCKETAKKYTPIEKEQTRLNRFGIIFKEFIKANFYLLKQFVKTIIRKDFRI